jgi:hypothetical protein
VQTKSRAGFPARLRDFVASNYFAAFLSASALLVISQVMSGSSILPK